MQVGHGDVTALERGQRLAAVKARGVVDKAHHVFGDADVFHNGFVDAAHGRKGHQALLHAFGDEAQESGVDKQVHLGRMRGLGEDVQHVAHAVAFRVHQVEAFALGGRFAVADVVQRVDHKINRNDVQTAPFKAHRRHPRRQDLAHALDQLEQVIRAVNLVHLARGAVAHHHGGAVNRPGTLELFAHDFFALVLGHEVRVLVVLGLVKHVLAEHAFIQARCRDRTDVVQLAHVNRLRKFNHVARAVDVDGDLAFFRRTQVVYRRKVVEVINLTFERLDVFRRHAELFGRQVAKHRDHAGGAGTPKLSEPRHLAFTFFANQEMHDRALTVQQFLDEALANEAGCAGDEILHEELQVGLDCCQNSPGFLPKAPDSSI